MLAAPSPLVQAQGLLCRAEEAAAHRQWERASNLHMSASAMFVEAAQGTRDKQSSEALLLLAKAQQDKSQKCSTESSRQLHAQSENMMSSMMGGVMGASVMMQSQRLRSTRGAGMMGDSMMMASFVGGGGGSMVDSIFGMPVLPAWKQFLQTARRLAVGLQAKPEDGGESEKGAHTTTSLPGKANAFASVRPAQGSDYTKELSKEELQQETVRLLRAVQALSSELEQAGQSREDTNQVMAENRRLKRRLAEQASAITRFQQEWEIEARLFESIMTKGEDPSSLDGAFTFAPSPHAHLDPAAVLARKAKFEVQRSNSSERREEGGEAESSSEVEALQRQIAEIRAELDETKRQLDVKSLKLKEWEHKWERLTKEARRRKQGQPEAIAE